MSEGNGAVVREVLFNQHVAIETSHLRNGKHTDTAE